MNKRIQAVLENEYTVLLVMCTAAVLCFGLDPAWAFDGGNTKYGTICQNVLGMAEGPFGAMLTAIAGIGAIIASAMGGFKAAWACVVVSVGGFILRGYLVLFFPECSG